jgi:hypothetical protein
MSLLSQVVSAKKTRPRRIILYGVEGIGKSTWAAGSPSPVFISTEDGISDIDVPSFPQARSYSHVMQATYELANQQHEFITLVLDSSDWLEKFIFTQVCDTTGAKSINDPYNNEVNYGKGYTLAMGLWDAWLELANQCREAGMNIVLIAHCHTPTFKDPSSDSYNRYEPKMHKTISERLREWCDEVFFANYETYTQEKTEGFTKRIVGVGNGSRVLHTTEMPSHKAKNRLGLPPQISMDAAEYWSYVEGKSNGQNTGE